MSVINKNTATIINTVYVSGSEMESNDPHRAACDFYFVEIITHDAKSCIRLLLSSYSYLPI